MSFNFLKKKDNKKGLIKINNSVEAIYEKSHELEIKTEQISIELIPTDDSLVEITNNKVLDRIKCLVPDLFKTSVAIGTAFQSQSQTLYKAVIPFGAKLANSQAMEGAKRGIYLGADGIRGHANLVAVDQTTTSVANVASATMGIASMVVGQYYITKINSELSLINDSISKILNFQDNQYKSKVIALVTQIKTISSYENEILENNELRSSELIKLNGLEHECIELLGHAVLTIAEYTKKNNLDYKAYEKELRNTQNWFNYQQILLGALSQIAELKFALHFGSISKEHCAALIPIYSEQVSKSHSMLNKWHEENIRRLGIDTEKNHRERPVFLRSILMRVGLEEFSYVPISKDTTKMITEQTSKKAKYGNNIVENLYNEDVHLISKDGKIYYVPAIKQCIE